MFKRNAIRTWKEESLFPKEAYMTQVCYLD